MGAEGFLRENPKVLNGGINRQSLGLGLNDGSPQIGLLHLFWIVSDSSHDLSADNIERIAFEFE